MQIINKILEIKITDLVIVFLYHIHIVNIIINKWEIKIKIKLNGKYMGNLAWLKYYVNIIRMKYKGTLTWW